MKLFLKAKHWQLFLVYCSPFIAQNLLGTGEEAGSRFSQNFVIVFLLFGLSTITLLGWIWTVAVELRPTDKVKELLVFRIAYFWVVIYIIICVMAIVGDLDNFRILLVPHLLTMVAIFYCALFAARRLKIIEIGHQATANDYIGFFFLIVLFPIGIWFLQPRVNKIYEAHGE